jgi:hypothetical protein
MWYKVKWICIEKWIFFYILVDFFIWIVIKNYWCESCDIKSEKSWNILMLIVIEKCKNKVEIFCIVCQTRP